MRLLVDILIVRLCTVWETKFSFVFITKGSRYETISTLSYLCHFISVFYDLFSFLFLPVTQIFGLRGVYRIILKWILKKRVSGCRQFDSDPEWQLYQALSYIFIWVVFRVWWLIADVSEHCVRSETSAIKYHTPGNNSKDYTHHLEHGESLKSRTLSVPSS
jgi:hypothetical protein